MAQTEESCLSEAEQQRLKAVIRQHKEARASKLLGGADARTLFRAAAGFPLSSPAMARIRTRLGELAEEERAQAIESAAKAAIKAAGGSPAEAARQLGIKPAHILIDAALGSPIQEAARSQLERALLGGAS